MQQVKVGVLGHFGKELNLLNGQTVKTKIVTEELQHKLGEDQVLTIDTHGGWKTLLKAPFQVFWALKKSENILIFPAHNGLRVYVPLLSFQRAFFRHRKIHYVVIGGWLSKFLLKRKHLASMLKRFDGIYVETNTMRNALKEQGFTNVYVVPNCKKLSVLNENDLCCRAQEPYKLCTFSRVMKEKGIEDAINAVKTINDTCGRVVFLLDIYGQIDVEQTEWFGEIKKKFPEYIKYKGVVPFDKSTEVLKNYLALLFPTRFFTEGIPGTIIDAYAAGLPIISAKWESYADIIVEEETGLGYEFNDIEQFKELLLMVAKKPQLLFSMKLNCINRAKEYLPETTLQVMMENFYL